MYRNTILAAMISGGIILSLQAEESLKPIIVTATRTAQTVDASLASVTVITRDEIERLQPAQFIDLLQNRAGISITSNGYAGKSSSINMRGTNSDHTLLLIDGVRMGSATLGNASWQFLPLAEIERIEIVRGPRASIYGADAIGGVIQVFTRQGHKGSPKVNAHTRIGSFNTRELGAGVQGGTERTRYSLSVSHQQTDGINIQEGIGDDDPDGYDNTSLSANLAHDLGSNTELFASLLSSQGRTETDVTDGGPDHTDFTHQAMRAGIRGSFTQNWFTELSFGHALDKNRNVYDPPYLGDDKTYFNTSRSLADWRNDINLGTATLLTLGLDWQQDVITSSNEIEKNRRYNQAIYQIIQTGQDRHNLQGSLRHDDNQAFGGHTTGQLAWGYDISPQLSGRLSYATAFKAPTFNDLYWPDEGWVKGNPDITPEKSETTEAGLSYHHGQLSWEASIYQTDISDLIAWGCAQNCDDGQWWTDIWQPQNIHKVRIHGMELEAKLNQRDWSSTLSVSLLDTEDRKTGNELARRPYESYRLDLDRQLGQFTLGGSALVRGRSYNNVANTDRISGHTLFNLRASWRPAAQWLVRANIDNLLDKQYITSRYSSTIDYNQPGRAYYLSVHYQQ